MNKLMGFYELQAVDLPAIPWKEYTGIEKMDENILWTVRSAVYNGNDLNLPRLVGVPAKEASEFANYLLKTLRQKGIVIYYPYFIAKKSGTLNIHKDLIIIEAVKDDLWNLVTFSDREVTIRITEDLKIIDGNRVFLSEKEQGDILAYVPNIKKMYRDDLFEGKSILIEWSFALNSDVDKNAIGDEYLVFYEMRTI